MVFEIDEGVPPIEGTHLETKHYSSVILQGRSGKLFVEIIPLRRNKELNHRGVKRASSGSNDLSMAQLAQSYMLLALEEAIRGGKTAKVALFDAMKPNSDEVEEAKKRFEGYISFIGRE